TRPNLYRSTLIADGDNKPRRYIARVASGKVRFAPEDKPGNTTQRVLRYLMDVDIPTPSTRTREPIPNCCSPGTQPTRGPIPAETPLPLEEEAVGPVREALTMSVALESRNQPPF